LIFFITNRVQEPQGDLKMPRAKKTALLSIIRESDERCVFTGSNTDCFLVSFADGTFTGVVCWSELLELIRRVVGIPERPDIGTDRK
jgi:hypothetical protein